MFTTALQHLVSEKTSQRGPLCCNLLFAVWRSCLTDHHLLGISIILTKRNEPFQFFRRQKRLQKEFCAYVHASGLRTLGKIPKTVILMWEELESEMNLCNRSYVPNSLGSQQTKIQKTVDLALNPDEQHLYVEVSHWHHPVKAQHLRTCPSLYHSHQFFTHLPKIPNERQRWMKIHAESAGSLLGHPDCSSPCPISLVGEKQRTHSLLHFGGSFSWPCTMWSWSIHHDSWLLGHRMDLFFALVLSLPVILGFWKEKLQTCAHALQKLFQPSKKVPSETAINYKTPVCGKLAFVHVTCYMGLFNFSLLIYQHCAPIYFLLPHFHISHVSGNTVLVGRIARVIPVLSFHGNSNPKQQLFITGWHELGSLHTN